MFDLSKFNKIKEDKDSTTLKHKTEDHEIRIVHAYIPKIRREQLKRLKLAEGGEAELKHKEREEARDAPLKPAGTLENYHEKGKNTPIGQMNRENDLKKFKRSKGPNIQGLSHGGFPQVVSAGNGEVDDQDNDQSPPPVAPAPTQITINAAPAAAPAQPQVPQNNAVKDFQEQSSQTQPQAPQVQDAMPSTDANGQPLPGNILKNNEIIGRNQQAVDTAKSQADAANENQYNQGAAENNQNLQDIYNFQAEKVKEFERFINENPMVADRRSIGSKVGDAFAIALSGVNGKGNPALDYLNNQLNRDFQAQKENVANHANVLGAYEHLYGKGVAANNSTMATLLDMYKHKALQTQAMLNTPQAAVNAQKFIQEANIRQQQLLRDGAASIGQLPGGRGGSTAPTGGPSQAPQDQPSGQSGASADWNSENGNGKFGESEAQASYDPKSYQGIGGSSKNNALLIPKADSILADRTKHDYYQKDPAVSTKLREEYDQATKTDEQLAQVDPLYDQMYKNVKEGGLWGRMHRGLNPNALGAVGGGLGTAAGALGGGLFGAGVGALPAAAAGAGMGTGLGESIGYGLKAASNTGSNQEYDRNMETLKGIISAALPGRGDMFVDEAAQKYAPQDQDTPEQARKKREDFKKFISDHSKNGTLKQFHYIKR